MNKLKSSLVADDKANNNVVDSAWELFSAVQLLTMYLKEVHDQNIDAETRNNIAHENDCSYCEAIEAGKLAIRHAKGKP